MQAHGKGLEHRAIGLTEAERVEMVHGRRPGHVKQEAAGVNAVSTAGRCLLDHSHTGAGVVGSDRRARPGRAEADDENVDRVGRSHAGGAVMMRHGSEPSQSSAAARTMA